MIRHIFKIIWAERRSNTWILLELILVFSILWFCTDYLFFMAKMLSEPKGFDIEHTYLIELGEKQNESIASTPDSLADELKINSTWTIYDRIKRYPGIESISLSRVAIPYTGSYGGGMYKVDTTSQNAQFKWVTPGFFDVFKVKFLRGASFPFSQIKDQKTMVISGDKDNKFGGRDAIDVQHVLDDWGNQIVTTEVAGVVNRVKRSEYEVYNPIVYKQLVLGGEEYSLYYDLSVRVKPEADKDFIEKFTRDMREQLDVSPYFLSKVSSFEDMRDRYMSWMGHTNNLKNVFSITGFLLVNIFLGVIGTFWFRVQSRRNEIGLRIALGASKRKVRNLFVNETLFLILLASIVASIICVNLSMTDIIRDTGLPTPSVSKEEMPVSQYFINYAITFVVLASIACFAVWYPAKKASDIQPAEALRSE